MSISVDSIIESLKSGIAAFPATLELILVSLVLGTVLGAVIAFVRFYKVPVLDIVFAAFVNVYQGIPFVVSIMIYHIFYLTYFSGIDIIYLGIFAMTLSSTCSTTETFRGVLKSIDFGQNEAGYSVGMTKLQTIRRIILPQVISLSIPSLTNVFIGLIKASSVVSVVGIVEVTQGSLTPSQVNYAFFEGYLAAAVIYWAFSIVVEFSIGKLEKISGRYRRT